MLCHQHVMDKLLPLAFAAQGLPLLSVFLERLLVALHSEFLVLNRPLEVVLHHLGLSLPCLPCLTLRAEMPLHPLVLGVVLRLLDMYGFFV